MNDVTIMQRQIEPWLEKARRDYDVLTEKALLKLEDSSSDGLRELHEVEKAQERLRGIIEALEDVLDLLSVDRR